MRTVLVCAALGGCSSSSSPQHGTGGHPTSFELSAGGPSIAGGLYPGQLTAAAVTVSMPVGDPEVALSADPPAGITIGFDRTTIPTKGASQSTGAMADAFANMSIALSPTLASGSYDVAIHGSASGVTRSTTLTLNVIPPQVTGFAVGVGVVRARAPSGGKVTVPIRVTPLGAFEGTVSLVPHAGAGLLSQDLFQHPWPCRFEQSEVVVHPGMPVDQMLECDVYSDGTDGDASGTIDAVAGRTRAVQSAYNVPPLYGPGLVAFGVLPAPAPAVWVYPAGQGLFVGRGESAFGGLQIGGTQGLALGDTAFTAQAPSGLTATVGKGTSTEDWSLHVTASPTAADGGQDAALSR